MAQRTNVISYMALHWWWQCSHCVKREKYHHEIDALMGYLEHLNQKHPRLVTMYNETRNMANQLKLAFGVTEDA